MREDKTNSLTNGQKTKRLLTDLVGREILARCSGKQRLFTTADGNRNICNEHHRSQKPLKKLDKTSSIEREKRRRWWRRGEKRREEERAEMEKRSATWARVERRRAHKRGKEHLAAGKSPAESALLRHQDLAPWNQQRRLN